MGRNKRRMAVIGAVALAVAFSSPAAGFFSDLAGHWAAPLIGALEARGIVSGDEFNHFLPDAPLTRSQLAKLLVAGLGRQEDARLLSGFPSRFHDVPKWHWANGYIEALAENGAVEGYPDGGFGPEDIVTRAQLAVILTRTAGLSEQARLMQFEQTGYLDDAAIPEWARGAVQVAHKAGLLEGFEDNSFRPLQPVTRAEGSVAFLRVLSLEGRAFHLSGTLMSFDFSSLKGVVRDFAGQEHAFTMIPGAQYYLAGQPAYYGEIRPLDQVWVVLGQDGTGTFLDSRYEDLLARDLRVTGSTLTVTLDNDAVRTMVIEPGAPVFLNGHPAMLAQTNKATLAYMALNRVSGNVRVLDAVNITASGSLLNIDPTRNEIVIQSGSGVLAVKTIPDATYLLNGRRVDAAQLRADDQVQLAQNAAGLAEYVMAER